MKHSDLFCKDTNEYICISQSIIKLILDHCDLDDWNQIYEEVEKSVQKKGGREDGQ